MKEVSIIIPLYNEEGNVAELHKEIKEVCIKNNYTYEIILVDDGSSDKTAEIAKQLSPVKYIGLRKNFGQTAAMDAGIKHAVYEYIITMDGDRQNDPNDIPALIEYLEKNNYDIVSGWRKNRKDNFFKKFVSRGANLLRSIIVQDGIHDSGCSLKIYKKECFNHLTLYGEMHRFIPAILKTKGFKVGEIVVNHKPRIAGRTKYSWKRTIKGFLDMLIVWYWNKYLARPLHLMGTLGLLFLTLGIISSIKTVHLFVTGQSLSDTVFPLLSAFLLITGVQFFISGLMIDILTKNYFESTGTVVYSIKEITDNKKSDEYVKDDKINKKNIDNIKKILQNEFAKILKKMS